MNSKLIITLLNIPKVGRKTVYNLIRVSIPKKINVEEIKSLFLKSKELNNKIQIPDDDIIENAIIKAEEIIKKSEQLNIKNITILDDDFPMKLKAIQNPPVIIYYIGNKECILNDKSLAIIGSRKAIDHSLKISYRLGKIFGLEDFVVISGLAKGCDEYAHKGCISVKGKTLAVLPAGLDSIYPAENTELAKEILKHNGCIISEYPVGEKPTKGTFVDRDRLQSALSKGVIVVEATVSSGTMHTANYALEQNKILACYKNCSIKNLVYAGNEKLITENNALEIKTKEEIEIFKNKILNQNDGYLKKEQDFNNIQTSFFN